MVLTRRKERERRKEKVTASREQAGLAMEVSKPQDGGRQEGSLEKGQSVSGGMHLLLAIT